MIPVHQLKPATEFGTSPVNEKVFYTDVSGGSLSFNTGGPDNVIALSGYDRNLTLDVKLKDVVVGGYGNDAKIGGGNKIGSGSLSIVADALTLGGDITTTYRTNANVGFDTGSVSLKAVSYSLSGDVEIKTNGDLANSDRGTRTPGSVSFLRGGVGNTGASALIGNGHSLSIDTASTESNVNGGDITAYFLAEGTSASNAVNNLSFTSSWASGLGGSVNLYGSAYNISGDFSATGRVTLGASSGLNNTMVSDFSIRTNVGAPAESGSIVFGGYSLTMNKGYGAATFDASATGSNAAGDITLWSSDMAGGSSLSAGRMLIDASAVDTTKAGDVAVDNLTTTGRATATSGSSYTAANLVINAKEANLAGNLNTRSGGSSGSVANTGDVLVQADTVTIADNVKIQTYSGYTGNPSNAHKTGLAGNVTLGNVGATLVGSGKTLEIDASAGRSVTGANTSFTAQHGTITINDTNAAQNGPGITFGKLTLIGSDVMGNGVRNYRTTGQMTLGFLDVPSVNLGSIEAGSLLLLGTGNTSYSASGAKVGTLAALDVDELTLATHASWSTAPLDAVGTADQLRVGLTYPLIRSQRHNLSVGAALQHSELTDEFRATDVVLSKSSTTLPLSLVFNSRDQFLSGGLLYGSLTYTAGSLRNASDFANTAGSFGKTNFEIARVQALGKGFSVFVKHAMQSASKNLDSSEDLFLGGASGVRAYPQGEASGDEGHVSSIELRYQWGNASPYVFYDRGRVETFARPTSALISETRTLSGAGIGVRYSTKNWNVDVAAAWRKTGGQPRSDLFQDPKPRWLLSVAYRF